MNAQRSEIWTTRNPDGSLNVHADEAEAVRVAEAARAGGDIIPILRHVELRADETIVGLQEVVVIEAAKAFDRTDHFFEKNELRNAVRALRAAGR